MKVTRWMRKSITLLIGLSMCTSSVIVTSPTYAAAKVVSSIPIGAAQKCAPSAVKKLVTTSRLVYSLSVPVKMTASIQNVSSTECSVWIGAVSPLFSISNSKGLSIWNNCDVNDRPGACPMFLAVHPLKPGEKYSVAVTWHQHSGAKLTRATPGKYLLTVSFSGFTITNKVKFSLIS